MRIDVLQFIVLLAGFAAFRALAIALPRGDTRRIDTAVALAGVFLVPHTFTVVLASIASGVAGGVVSASRHQDRSRRKILGEWATLVASSVVGILAVRFLETEIFGRAFFADGQALSVLVLGLAYSAIAEAGWLSFRAWISKRPFSLAVAEPVWLTHLVHVTLAAAGIRAAGALGILAVVFCLLLALLLHYGLILYVRMRAAYAQTIRGVSRAIRLALPEASLDWESLADLCVAVGKRIGLTARTLEALNDAALLSGIGLLGEKAPNQEDAENSTRSRSLSYLSRSAAAVSRIPRMATAAAIMGAAGVSGVDNVEILQAGEVLRCCLIYSHALAETQNRVLALEITSETVGEHGSRVVDVLRGFL